MQSLLLEGWHVPGETLFDVAGPLLAVLTVIVIYQTRESEAFLLSPTDGPPEFWRGNAGEVNARWC